MGSGAIRFTDALREAAFWFASAVPGAFAFALTSESAARAFAPPVVFLHHPRADAPAFRDPGLVSAEASAALDLLWRTSCPAGACISGPS